MTSNQALQATRRHTPGMEAQLIRVSCRLTIGFKGRPPLRGAGPEPERQIAAMKRNTREQLPPFLLTVVIFLVVWGVYDSGARHVHGAKLTRPGSFALAGQET